MTDTILTEKDLLISIRMALAIDAFTDALDAMTQLAGLWIERGDTQEGADLLAFVMRDKRTHPETYDKAEDFWDGLATYACPRVMVDAEDFGKKATFDDVVEYIFV